MFYCVKPALEKYEIKRSVFIAVSDMIASRDDAREKLDRIRGEYRDATHVCWAYIADESGDDFRYDDDGEPSGTAGKPIYSALAASGARKSMIAVVRYFGGIKLGAGGLARAYRDSAAGLIERAGLSRAEKVFEFTAECDGDAFKKLSALARGVGCKIDVTEYNSTVRFALSAPSDADAGGILEAFGARVLSKNERYAVIDG